MIRSLSKVLGPDLRIAPMAGDALTISQVEGRQLLGAGWVSHLLQQTAAEPWASQETRALLARAERGYAQRRAALTTALSRRGITAYGGTGLGVWVPLTDETPGETAITQRLLDRGWAVSPGERYRSRTGPGLRITTAALSPGDAERLAAALDEIVRGTAATYAG